jgi:hypothetical protein
MPSFGGPTLLPGERSKRLAELIKMIQDCFEEVASEPGVDSIPNRDGGA